MSMHTDHHPHHHHHRAVEDGSLWPAIVAAVVLFGLAAFVTWVNM